MQFSVSFSDFLFSYDMAGFDPVRALKGVTINGIRNGEMVFIVGPNASGKSTFLDLIAERRKRRKENGTIEAKIDGSDVDYKKLLKVYVPQKPYEGLVPDLSIAENAVLKKLLCRAAGITPAVTEAARDVILAKCHEYGLTDISQRLDMPPSTLSGGQQQLLNVLSAIIAEPHLLILDEPTSKLDEVNSIRVWNILCAAAKNANIAIICVTHDSNIVSKIADRIVSFEEGKVLNEKVVRQPKEPRYIGEIRRVSLCQNLPTCFANFNDNWWSPINGTLFGDDYFVGDDSKEGYLSARKMDREERTNREINGLIRLLKMDSTPNAKVLDAPCGWGRHSIALAKRGFEVTGFDVNENYINMGKANIGEMPLAIVWKIGDLRNLTEPDASYDFIINMWTSFGFFGPKVDQEILKNYSNCLKPNGRILIHLDLNPIRVTRGIFDEPPYRSLKNEDNLEVREWYCDEDKAVYGLWKLDRSNITHLYRIFIYGDQEWAGFASEAGLRVEAIYGGFDEGADVLTAKSQEFIVVLRKK